MSEEEGAYSMSVKHFLMVSNSVWTQQPFALLALLYTSMGTVASSSYHEHSGAEWNTALY